MSTRKVFGKERSDAQVSNREWSVERFQSFRDTCPECGGSVVANRHTTHCEKCGLVVSEEHVDRGPTMVDLGLVGFGNEKSIETVNPFRSDKGLHTKISTGNDGYGNPLTAKQRRKFRKLRKWHKRFQFDGQRKRDKRLNEGLKDVEMLGANLSLPGYVQEDAARWLKQASEERLPGGHMAWESLAAGAVALAARGVGLPRATTEVAQYAKATHERVCAAARKIRIELGLDVPPIRSETVEAVLDTLDEDALDGDAYLKLVVLGRHLMELADEEEVGSGTPRLTVAASAVYAVDRMTDEKWLTQRQVVDVASEVVDMSTSKIGSYSRELFDAYVDRHGTDNPSVVLDGDRFRLG